MALVTAGPASSADPAPPLRIGVSLGLSGTYAAISDMQKKAYRLWEHDVNQRGGILGRKVELIIRDDKSDPEISKRIYVDYIEREKVDFVFGPYSSAITAVVAPVTEQH